ncbi:hypothetical protein CXB51_020010 [Gossypium anomalum]|uniref:DUF3730 domain-containing protein n=1 Tax=Gossypium anomalum TaxID=47600 RepID=A0A8J5YWV8_9ROSI|nr:hypothetical protein CXB51_020010 [Gossypium anomalum]
MIFFLFSFIIIDDLRKEIYDTFRSLRAGELSKHTLVLRECLFTWNLIFLNLLALEGSDPKFVPLFVKSLGFLVCVGYERSNRSWKPESHEDHPFVKIISSRREVERELVNQVLLFMVKNKGLGMVEVCEFLRHFLIFSILRINASDSSLFLFARQLITSMASFGCSIPNQALPIFRALIRCLKYFPLKSLEETRNFCYVLECLVDSFTVVLRQLVGNGACGLSYDFHLCLFRLLIIPYCLFLVHVKRELIIGAQLCGVELIENVLSLYTSPCKQSDEIEPIVELLKHMLVAQKDLALHYMPELASWKSEIEYAVNGAKYFLSEELLVIFPVISLISSPSKSVKGAANDLLVLLERLLVKLLTMPKINLAKKVGYPSISRSELIAYRLLQHLWFELFCYTINPDGVGTVDAASFTRSQYRGNGLPPIREAGPQRSARNRLGENAVDPVLMQSGNPYFQGNYLGQPFQPTITDGGASVWTQAPGVPYMHGSNIGGPMETRHRGSSNFSHSPLDFRNPNFHHHVPPIERARGHGINVHLKVAPVPYCFLNACGRHCSSE